jgi:hypothetical protein
MASCNTSNYTNILDLPQALDISTGNYLIVEKPDEGTYILDFSDFIITLENTTFAPLIFSLQTQITQISAITQTFVNNLSGSNVLVGIGVGTNISTGLDNIAIGKSSMSQGRVVGIGNIGIGSDTLDKITDGTYNIGIGRQALANLTTGDSNIAIGQNVMSVGNVISDNNIAIGKDALDRLTTGYYNIAVGASVMSLSAVTGNYNLAVGREALDRLTGGDRNIGIGAGVMSKGEVTGSNNVAIGTDSLDNLTTGSQNTCVGLSAGQGITVGFSNVALGTESMHLGNVTGYGNVAVGRETLTTVTSGYQNVALGRGSLQRLTTGFYNVGVGLETMSNNTVTGNSNVAVGAFALGRVTNAERNVAVGFGVMNNNTVLSAGSNTGSDNVAVGVNSLDDLTSGFGNIAVGANALQKMQTGFGNTAIGYNIMTDTSTTATGNIAIGYSTATFMGSGADYNIAIGTNACERLAKNSDYNVGVGVNALGQAGTTTNALSGQYNVALGYYAGSQMLSGSNCIHIGNNSGSNTQNTRGASDVICIGRNSGFFSASSIPITNSVAIGLNALINSSNQIVLGNNNTDTFVKGGVVQTISDARDKVDIRDTQLGLNFISKLRPVEYRYDLRENYYDRETKIFLPKDGSQAGKRYHQGLVAQEVKQAADELNVDFDGYQDMKVKGGSDVLSLGYSSFIAPLIKAVQELTVQNQELLSRIEALESTD